ncbi:uncharacterized protein [Clytia hemisphaerica]|uniref:uncharacterized protein n=1 Tax=Clytia hemisphaerica TaxID=252671 RepID=UPI0034D74FE8
MSTKVKVSLYYCFQTYGPPFYQAFFDFKLGDTISCIRRAVYLYALRSSINTFEELILLFDEICPKFPLDDTTRYSTLLSSNNEKNEIKLYFCLSRCKKNLELVERMNSNNQLRVLWRLIVLAFGTNKMVTSFYTDQNIAEIYDHIESITGLPTKNLMLISNEKEIFQYANQSVFKQNDTETESILIYVVAYFQENKKLENICLQYGIKHLKSLKLRFLTKEEELNPREMGSIKDIKNYVHKTHNIPLHQQSILYQHQEIENDSTKIFDLFSQKERLEGGVICFNVVINKKPFEIETAVYHLGFGSCMMTVVHVSYSDTIAEVKMKILENHYGWKLENIQKQLDDKSSAVSSTG